MTHLRIWAWRMETLCKSLQRRWGIRRGPWPAFLAEVALPLGKRRQVVWEPSTPQRIHSRFAECRPSIAMAAAFGPRFDSLACVLAVSLTGWWVEGGIPGCLIAWQVCLVDQPL